MQDDLVFTGRLLKLRTGGQFEFGQDDISAFEKLKPGVYEVILDDIRARKDSTWNLTQSIQTCSIPSNVLLAEMDRFTVAIDEITQSKASMFNVFNDRGSLYKSPLARTELSPRLYYFLEDYARFANKNPLRLRVDLANKPPWMKTAKSQIGVKEVKGKKGSNPKIEAYHRAAGLNKAIPGAKDHHAWCGSFVAWVMKQHGYIPPHKSYGARRWRDFGRRVNKDKISYGTIAFKYRNNHKPGDWKGHVGFVMGTNKSGDKIYLLGGNQSDMVCVAEKPRSVFIHYMLPSDYDSSEDWLPIFTGDYDKVGKEW